MIETDKAYELFEKALVRGVTSAGIELLKLFGTGMNVRIYQKKN